MAIFLFLSDLAILAQQDFLAIAMADPHAGVLSASAFW